MGCNNSRKIVPLAPGITLNGKYFFGPKLGKGCDSVVLSAQSRSTGEYFAIKCYDRRKISSSVTSNIQEEIDILKLFKNNKYIMNIIEYFHDDYRFYLVFEIMYGNDLLKLLSLYDILNENYVKKILKNILIAINELHNQHILHRDLKLEAITFKNKYLPDNYDENNNNNDNNIHNNNKQLYLPDPEDVRIIDFGSARKLKLKFSSSRSILRNKNINIDDDNKNNDKDEIYIETERVGTPSYVAPELLKLPLKYGKEIDIWSLGVIFYMLLSGQPPFHGNTQTKLYENIKIGKYNFNDNIWSNISNDAKDLINKILVIEPFDRITASEALNHSFFNN